LKYTTNRRKVGNNPTIEREPLFAEIRATAEFSPDNIKAVGRFQSLGNEYRKSCKNVNMFLALPEYEAADPIMWYLDARSEVRTRPHLPDVVPTTPRRERANKLGL
jgi:hypothetical protein